MQSRLSVSSLKAHTLFSQSLKANTPLVPTIGRRLICGGVSRPLNKFHPYDAALTETRAEPFAMQNDHICIAKGLARVLEEFLSSALASALAFDRFTWRQKNRWKNRQKRKISTYKNRFMGS